MIFVAQFLLEYLNAQDDLIAQENMISRDMNLFELTEVLRFMVKKDCSSKRNYSGQF